MSDKLSTKQDSPKMTSIAPEDARKFVRCQLEDIAVSRRPGETVGAMLRRVARDAGIGFSKVRRYWYGEVDNIPWHEAETIRQRAEQVRDRWMMIQRRQDLANAMTDLKRTEEYGAEIERRRLAASEANAAREEADEQSAFLFWLGGSAAELDREGDA